MLFISLFAAFDFRKVCIGCPLEGTAEAEAAQTVAQYVVRDLTAKAAAAQAITNHLGLETIKKFMKDSDGAGGFHYSIQLAISESDCPLSEEFDPAVCAGNLRDTRVCSARVHERPLGEKAPRGVFIRRYEVQSTFCKDPADSVNLARPATVQDQDVVDIAKALTKQVQRTMPKTL